MTTLLDIQVIQQMVYLETMRTDAFGRRTKVVERVNLDLENVPEDEINDLYPLTEVRECDVHMDVVVEHSERPDPMPYNIDVKIRKIDLEFVIEGDFDDDGDSNFRRSYDVTIKPPFPYQGFNRVDENGFIEMVDGPYFSDMDIRIDMAGGSDTDNWTYEIDVGV